MRGADGNDNLHWRTRVPTNIAKPPFATANSRGEPIKVFYTPEMVADVKYFSPSPRKPRLVVEDWIARGLPVEVVAPAPVSPEDFELAHDPAYVRGVLSCRLRNGFGDTHAAVARSLPYTTGSLLDGAGHVLAHGGIACSPTSGFHHAGWGHGGGYCTFNGLMVVAAKLKREGRIGRIGILDCDQHFGDGTEEIIERLGARSWVTHFTHGRGYSGNARPFLRQLPLMVEAMRECDLVLYQAGADPHIDDPLGGYLTSPQLAERDRIVFEKALELEIPLVWNLAGGYQEPVEKVLEIHRATMMACASVAESRACA